MRYYLSQAGVDACKKLGTETDFERLYDSHMVKSKRGDHYFEVSVDPLDPLYSSPAMMPTHVEKVEYVGEIRSGFKDQGIYKTDGATLRLETSARTFGATVTYYQKLRAIANSEAELFDIYSGVRNGSIEPSDNWGGDDVSELFGNEAKEIYS